MMKENQKLLLLCGDSYQDISLLAAVKEAQKLNAKDGMLWSFIWAKKILSPRSWKTGCSQ